MWKNEPLGVKTMYLSHLQPTFYCNSLTEVQVWINSAISTWFQENVVVATAEHLVLSPLSFKCI